MIFGIFILLVAVATSAVAAYFSIVGITQIFSFPETFWAVATMAAVLEVCKLTLASALYQYWIAMGKFLKVYLVSALIVLMVITSMGIFGFLARAHYEAVRPAQPVQEQISQIDANIEANNKRIADNQELINGIRQKGVDEALKGEKSLKDTNKAIGSIESGAIAKIQKDIDAATKENTTLQDKKNLLLSNLHNLEAEVGPVKYIAQFIYGEGSYDVMDRAIRIVIILIVSVFDPLAVALLIAANIIISLPKPKIQQVAPRMPREKRIKPVKRGPLDEFTTVIETKDGTDWNKKQVTQKDLTKSSTM